jgi:hypothetical protein
MAGAERARGQNPFADLPRCGARNRRGTPFRRPAGPKGRCYYHGCVPGSGGPPGKRNGNYRHGHYTKEAIAERKKLNALLKRCSDHLGVLKG